jgi:hypothetical protein
MMDLDTQIGEWRAYLASRPEVAAADADELESHLRDQVDTLRSAGLNDDEAFLVAVKRLGSIDALTREFAREHSERMWKQLVATPEVDASIRGDFWVMLGWAVAAAAVVLVPRLVSGDADAVWSFYLRNTGLLVLPMLVGYFAWKRRVPPRRLIPIALVFIAGAVFANAYPFARFGSTEVLTAIHLVVVLWLVFGSVYLGGRWRTNRMDFVRFTGEWFIYYVLIALGGGVLLGLTVGVFSAIGLNIGALVFNWLLPAGAAGAVLVAAWLVEAKQAVVENMAPVLTNVFTPLFAVMFVASVGAIVFTGHGVDVERDVLILFDVLLVVVLGLLLYSISARDPLSEPELPDIIQLTLVVSALVIDVLALVAIVGRIAEMGFTPNRTAALGLNVVLLANLSWSAWLSIGFFRGRRPYADLEQWHTSYLPVYLLWGALVVIVFPLVFGFA